MIRKKVLLVMLLSFALLFSGCSKNEGCEAKYHKNDTKITIDIDYSQDKLIGYDLELRKKVSKNLISKVGEENIDSYVKDILSSLYNKGVDVDSEYLINDQEIVIYLDVDVKDLNKSDYDLFGINKKASFQKFKSLLEKNDFKVIKE